MNLWRFLVYYSGFGAVESDARGTVGTNDDAAASEPGALERGEHGAIVAMGVDADVVDLAETILDASGNNPGDFAARRNAVDSPVGLVVEPCAVNDVVSRVAANDKGKRRNYFARLIDPDVQIARFNIGGYFLFAGITTRPLGHVAHAAHELLCRPVNRQYSRRVGLGGFPYYNIAHTN